MSEHVLKCWPPYWDAVESGDKNFDVRQDDRGFQKGDVVVLQRYKAGYGYSTDHLGKALELRKRIGWILTGGQFGIEPGYVVLALADITPDRPPTP